ncbi:glutaminyl-peptide cyclotransferase [Pseudodesulfovibrio thermohalotolerans]|uniref:glutaminyl-peptide cyclotransferase n=1 Tax=Pseudodesulfovibrio thermohalotolerans TaxID=2880651 RepID=UPI0024426B47|nr:glutaminyl-peptide cyclotransferase [Pseudodesulfovibrio thermohalotolerans]WFS63260.1 glutaminyl-peptide cyclotransferase [Pseudodesulfovibrio thermohalotolerans]
MHKLVPILMLLVLTAWAAPATAQTPVIPCRVVAEYPHDAGTSTQGLFHLNGVFYESSGGYKRSFVAMVEPKTGRRLKTVPIAPSLFAEGIAPQGDALWMLTWKSGIGLIHALKDLAPSGRFAYRSTFGKTEGWGLAFDGEQFFMSTGKSRLELRDAKDFTLTGTMEVTDEGRPVRLLNELEFVGKWLYANIWKSDRVAIIDPADGKVRAWLDISSLRKRIDQRAGTANGIAYDAAGGRLYVTGKCWDRLFEIKIPELR